ncbi:MAG: ATP-binding protein [Candidatus Heimdallarchaeota archaeon]|nr:ATP-binding protein [Candidatus Heimdallarchaeota archaeon]
MSLSDQFILQNRHWEKPYPVPKFRRHLFEKLDSNLALNKIITLVGPRRVGKTTMLHQLINKLLQQQVPAEHILYFSLDLYSHSLLDVYNQYTSMLSLEYRGEYYLIFDEIQYLDDWASHIKLLYDHLPECHIIISGSSASDLHRGKESLAGREYELFLPPMSFTEYLQLKGVTTKIDTILWREYLLYMDHQLPELITSGLSPREYVVQLVHKVINNDFVRLHNIRDTTPITSIFKIICNSPGDVIINSDLGNELGLDARTVQSYLTFLEKSLLIRKVYNYSTSPRKVEARHKRYYPYYTTLHLYTSSLNLDFGKKVETEVAFQVNAEYFWRQKTSEIDFIIGPQLDMGVEVKMRNTIKNSHIRALLNSKIAKTKLVITKQDSIISFEGATAVPLHQLDKIAIS